MNRLLRRFNTFSIPNASVPLALLLVCVASYGLLFRWLGFYWDEFPMIWIGQTLGSEGLGRYFATNRPFWGMIYQLTTPLLGSVPWRWQLFGLFWRWLQAVLVWALLRQVWPRRPHLAAWSSLLLAVYPGFDQQFISLLYTHFFIVFSAYSGSLLCSLYALRRPRWFWPLTLLGLLLSLVNLLAMEYFLLLDALRPVLFWLALAEEEPDWRRRLRRTLLAWAPYLLLFLGVGIWRAFFFPYQTQNYTPRLLLQFKEAPLAALSGLILTILADLWKVTFAAWGEALRLPDVSVLGARTTGLYALVILAALAVLLPYLLRLDGGQEPAPRHARLSGAGPALTGGVLALLIAGWPFWITRLAVGLDYPASRFTLSFVLGACLVAAGLLQALPVPRWGKAGLLALLLALSIGMQFATANEFRRDWSTQKNLFWQLAWRAPHLKPGTTVVSNDLPLHYYSDNSLAAPLNWLYAPDNRSQTMRYMFYYPTVRLGLGLKSLEKGIAIQQDYLAAAFHGSTDQIITIHYNPPACLRVLDPELDSQNGMLTPLMRSAAQISSRDAILPASDAQPASRPPASMYDPEPAHGWCYFYEKADLARQQQDWQTVVDLGEQAFQLGDYPNDPAERLPFIEGYAHTGNWTRALELSEETRRITPMMRPVLCALWQRIAATTPATPEQQTSLQTARSALECQP